MARLVSYAVAGVPNDVMGEGPIPASRMALKKAGLTVSQMDVVESNEAFAAQAITVTRALELDPAKTNPNGGAIALSHHRLLGRLHRHQGCTNCSASAAVMRW
jgi:acetyl-CoA C-acetyltransferase